jgi:pyruvate,orthophosphate dikinase
MLIAHIGDGQVDSLPAEVIGGKAANLARMAALGLPVPPAFVLPIELCASLERGEADAERRLAKGLEEGIDFLETATGKSFGDRRDPLLVSVRSGAARSMPGMLDTVLDVGCTETATRGLVRRSGNPRFAWDCRCRFLESHGSVVHGLEPAIFERVARTLVAAEGVGTRAALDGEALERLARDYLDAIEDEKGQLSESRWRRSPRPRAPSTALGSATAPAPIASCSISRTSPGRRSPCRPWCSAIAALARVQASPSRAIPRPARRRR